MKKLSIKLLVALPVMGVLLLSGCRTTVHTHTPRPRATVVVKPTPRTVVVHHHHIP